MKKKNKNIEKELEAVRFRELSDREAENSWQIIESRLAPAQTFSLWQLKTNRKTMIPLLIGALLFASAGGTVAASNSALPGDALFGVDRAVENVRIALARSEGKAELKLKFAEERLLEVQKLVAEARAKAAASTASTTATSTATTTATSTATSAPSKSKDNVALGINVAIAYLNEVADDLEADGNTEAVATLESVVNRLESLANDSDVKVKLKNNGAFQLRLKGEVASSTASSTATTTGDVRINTSGNKSRIEVREDGERIRIEIKDNGNVKIKSKVESEDDENDSDGDDRDDDKDDNKDNRGRGRGINLNSNVRLNLR